MENSQKIKSIITDYKNKSNSDLKFALTNLSEDFEETKKLLIKLSSHLDSTEKIYNDIFKELKKRGE